MSKNRTRDRRSTTWRATSRAMRASTSDRDAEGDARSRSSPLLRHAIERAQRGRARVRGRAEERGGDAVARDRILASARALVEARGFEVSVAEDGGGTRSPVLERQLELR